MWRKRMLFTLVALCALIAVWPALGAEGAADQLKQAERLCTKKQFAEAEQVYLGALERVADAEQRFAIVRKLAGVFVAQDKLAQAKTTVEQILSDYAQHARLPHAIHEIAESCNKLGKAKEIKDIYAQILQEQPGRSDAIWLIMGQAIADTLAGDDDAAWESMEKLLNEYNDDSRAVDAVSQVALSHEKIKDYINARQLYRHILEVLANNEQAIYAQIGVVRASIVLRDPNSAKAAVDDLLSNYSGNKDYVKVVSDVAETYRRAGKFEDSRKLHEYIVDYYKDDEQGIWSQQYIVFCSIVLMDEDGIDAGIEKLFSDFSSRKEITEVAYEIGHRLRCRYVEKAKTMFEYVLSKDSSGRLGALARVGLGGTQLREGDDKGARAVFDSIIEEYQDQAILPEVVYLIANTYWNQACTRRDPEARFLTNKIDPEYEYYVFETLGECERIINGLPGNDFYTAEANLLAGRCRRELGQFAHAIERYETITENWPEHGGSAYSQYAVMRCVEKLMRSKTLTKNDALTLLRYAFQKVTSYYPDSMPANAANTLLDRWERHNAEGRKQ